MQKVSSFLFMIYPKISSSKIEANVREMPRNTRNFHDYQQELRKSKANTEVKISKCFGILCNVKCHGFSKVDRTVCLGESVLISVEFV